VAYAAVGKHIGDKLPEKFITDDEHRVQGQIAVEPGAYLLHNEDQHVNADKEQDRIVIPVPEGLSEGIHTINIRSGTRMVNQKENNISNSKFKIADLPDPASLSEEGMNSTTL
jgi:hypothetical protein